MKKKLKVDIQYACEQANLPDKNELTQWASAALFASSHQKATQISKKFELTLRIVDEQEGKQLNETWRQSQGATNVLSFPFECPEEIHLNLLGDIIICAPVVRREACEQKKNLQAHWAHLVIHGTLHLLGYDHHTPEQAHIMETLEIELLHSLGYPNPYYYAPELE